MLREEFSHYSPWHVTNTKGTFTNTTTANAGISFKCITCFFILEYRDKASSSSSSVSSEAEPAWRLNTENERETDILIIFRGTDL